MHEVGALLRRAAARSRRWTAARASRRFEACASRSWPAASAAPASCAASAPPARTTTITAIVNTGDDVTLHGLRICPDLDSCMYTLGGVHDHERGWGRAGETWRIKDELDAYGAEPTWFGLGDLDIATHLVRTRMLDAGYPLSDVTAALCARWQPGRHAAADERRALRDARRGRALDGPAAGRSTSRSGGSGTAPRCPREAFVQVGLDDAEPAPGVLEAIAERRRGAGRAEQPGGVDRHDPRAARRSARPSSPDPHRWSGSRRSSAARRCAAWPTPACRRLGVEVTAEGVGPPLRRAQGRRPARRLAGPRHATPPTCPASRSAPSRC